MTLVEHDGELVGKCDCPEDTPVLNKEQFACEACPADKPVWNAKAGETGACENPCVPNPCKHGTCEIKGEKPDAKTRNNTREVV